MAPVARRIADAQQNRLILSFRPLQCLIIPRVPIHRIMRMLLEVRALFREQMVGGQDTVMVSRCTQSRERSDLGTRWDLLEELAASSGGKVLRADEADEILKDVTLSSAGRVKMGPGILYATLKRR